MKTLFVIPIALFMSMSVVAQTETSSAKDSSKLYRAKEIEVTGVRSSHRALRDVEGVSVYASKKTEAIQMNGTEGNFSLNNTRQAFARTPGVFVWEQDGGGIQAGVAVRGLSPNRSWEFNTRKDGYDISSEIFGYPEAYYTPPYESLERIELVRGAASLQYGPQFGGLLNYITKSGARDKPFSFESSQLVGAQGLYSTYTAAGGTIDRVNYYSFVNFRGGNSWRQNNNFTNYTGYARVNYASDIGTFGFSVTHFNYNLRQPGGLTEAQFLQDAQQAVRARDWFGTPWTIPVLTYDHAFSEKTRLAVKAFGLFGQRNSIGLTTAPTVRDSLTNPRRIDQDIYTNFGTEARLLTEFEFLGQPSALATGLRVYSGNTQRDRGRGFDGDDFNMSYRGARILDLDFTTQNVAAFAEAKLALTNTFSITPGARIEYLRTIGGGTFTTGGIVNFEPTASSRVTPVNKTFTEAVPLFGFGASFRPIDEIELYSNIAQAYRPALFSDQFQNDLVAVDENLKTARGFSSDIGVRGFIDGVLTYDIGAFFMIYGDRVGVLNRFQADADSNRFVNGLRTNVGTSRHYGFEGLIEVDFLQLLAPQSDVGSLSLFSSVAYTNATYITDNRAGLANTSGSVQGKEVEFSPDWIVRGGLTYRLPDRLSITVQASHVGKSFSNASNTEFQADGIQGVIPEYTVLDVSATAKVLSFLSLELNVNNLLDRHYFTRRAGGYPGPGIIPAEGRLANFGVRINL